MLSGYDDLLAIMEVVFKRPSEIFAGHRRARRKYDLIGRCSVDESSGCLGSFLEDPTVCQFANAIISTYII
jgi:hypothetical protein